MKKSVLLIAVFCCALFTRAQVITDTVSLGQGYANQKWYSLQNDEQGSAPKDNWDLAFDVSGFGTSIHINSITGTMLWTYPHGAIDAWTTVDTVGITSWLPKYNSDTSWGVGALDKGQVPTNGNDVGWGIYNSITHTIAGDSLFIIKLANGSYKKLAIQNLAGGGYNFDYADINGSNSHTHFIQKSTYADKNFGYYSISNNTELNREPVVSANWDILFTQYTAFIPSPYTVAGVLSNKGVEVVQVNDVSDINTYSNWPAHAFSSDISTIGYDWKAFAGTWNIEDSLVYFVKSKPGDIWKVIFTGFTGSGTGSYIFSKEKLSATGIKNNSNEVEASFALYPNPSHGEPVNLIYSSAYSITNATFTLIDLSGRNVQQQQLQPSAGMQLITIPTAELQQGMYIVMVTVDGKSAQQKLVIK